MTSDGKIYRDVSHASMSPQEMAELSAAMDAALAPVTHWAAALKHKFDIGDEVEKYTGDYVWAGTVCSIFTTPHGKLRYVVAHPVAEGYVLHIYSEANLRRVA